jgi:hypothetical protein
MLIFGGINDRGCFMAFRTDTSAGKGVILQMPSLELPERGLGAIVCDMRFQMAETVAHLQCFEETIYTYTFGMRVSRANVGFYTMITSGNEWTSSADSETRGGAVDPALKDMLSAYGKDRITKSHDTVTLILPASAATITGQLVGIEIQPQDPQHNVFRVSYDIAVIDPPEG